MAEVKTKGTEYIVLGVIVTDDEDNVGYQPIDTVTANNDKQAILAAVGENPTPGNYVAIPVRSFHVRQVGAKTVTSVTVG